MPGRIDPRLDQSCEFVEDRVLQGNGKCKDPVEPALDRRQVFHQRTIGSFNPEAGQLLELGRAHGIELAHEQQSEPAMKRILGVGAFEIVSGIEQVLTASLALTAGERTKAVEPPGDGRDEPAFAAHIGGDRPEQRSRSLVGAVGPA